MYGAVNCMMVNGCLHALMKPSNEGLLRVLDRGHLPDWSCADRYAWHPQCRIMTSVSPTPHSAVVRSEQWLDLCSRPSERTLNGGPDGRRVTPCLVLWTLFEKSSVKTRCSFTSCPGSCGANGFLCGKCMALCAVAWTWRLISYSEWSSLGTINLII